MNILYILLGGNLGDVESTFKKAKRNIEIKIGKIIKESSLYESEAWGFESENIFLNEVIIVESPLQPIQVLKTLLNIENELGRVRVTNNYASRTIDLDILYFNRDIIELPELVIPHPMLHKRRFSLLPLSEIAENFIHPIFKTSNISLLQNCEDNLLVKKRNRAIK